MERNFETTLITLCAPTLAGLKPANLFRFVTKDSRRFYDTVAHWSDALAKKGVSIRVLMACSRTNSYLVYLYRPSQLQAILNRSDFADYLRGVGYKAPQDCEAALAQLSEHLCCNADFPHEIGVFLGYPLADIIGFVENKGKNFTCCGCWKTYGDPAAAKTLFERYRKCTEIYLQCFRRGTPITRLAVAV